MNLANIIQDRTNDGITIVEFLIAVMRAELDGFKPCHRLDAAKLLVKYERDEAFDFTLDNPPEPSRRRSGSGSSSETEFDKALAKVIRESTDDGRSVCRFLINVMEGELSAFKPHHRISAARELLSRGFGKHAREEAAAAHALSNRPAPSPRRSGEEPVPGLIRDRNPEEAGSGGSHSSLLSTHSSEEGSREGEKHSQAQTPVDRPPLPQGEGWGEGEKPEDQPDPEEEKRWAEINEIIDDAIERSDRIMAEQAEKDPDNIPYVPDLSAFNEAWENSQKWMEEWKNSIDPEEYRAIIKEKAANFDAKIEARIERRKQIAADRERREKEEAEREAQQAEAEAEAESEEPPEPRPPTRSQHRRKLMFVLGESIYVDCDHPDCDLHEQDRSRFRGSVQYGAGPTTGHFP